MATCSSGRSLGVRCCCCCDDDCCCWLDRPRSVSLDRLVVRLMTSRMLFLDFFDLVLSSPRWTIEWIGWRSSLWCGDGGCWWWNWGGCCGWGWWWRVSYATPCWLWWCCWWWCVALLDLLAEINKQICQSWLTNWNRSRWLTKHQPLLCHLLTIAFTTKSIPLRISIEVASALLTFQASLVDSRLCNRKHFIWMCWTCTYLARRHNDK